MSTQTAMILAAGRGERLRPLTDRIPKPLVMVGARRLIEYHLLALAAAGIRRVVINIAHLGSMIEQALGDGAGYGVEILYSREPEGALETAGGIRHALALLGEAPFIVVNGDIRSDFDFAALELDPRFAMHLVLVPNPAHHPDGDFALDRDRRPAPLLETPGIPRFTFSGIGIYRPAVFRDLAPGRQALGPVIRQHIHSGTASGETHEGYWLDVGDRARLEQARRDVGD